MDQHGAPGFFRAYSSITSSRINETRLPSERAGLIEGQRTEGQTYEATIDAATMLESLSWLRVSGTAPSESSRRLIEDGRNEEHHRFKPQVPPQQAPRLRTAGLPRVMIPIEHQYRNAPSKPANQFALPTRDVANQPWPLPDVVVMQELAENDDAQQNARSSGNSGFRNSISPISPCSTRQVRNSSVASNVSPISLLDPTPYPPPSKPLPSLPSAPSISHSTRQGVDPSTESERSSLSSASHFSPKEEQASTISRRPSDGFSHETSPKPLYSPAKISRVDLEAIFWKELGISGKRKGASKVKAIDAAASGSMLAIKHANYSLQFWNIAGGTLQSTIEVPTYIDAGKRAKDSFELGHMLISDSAKLVAIITNFGRTLEIWNWTKRKKLQTLDDQVDRWTADRFESYSSRWNPLAIYKARPGVIDLYAAAPSKKPYAKVRIIDLRKAELPYVPQQLELAILPTSPMLVAAVGPKSAKAGHPPPDREILLAAWDITDYREVSHIPRHYVRPLHHTEIELEVPSTIVGYGNTVISIWVPPSHRVYRQPHPRTGIPEWKLSSITGPVRHVLVWELSGNVTRVYQVPNTVTCISSDCQFGAYSSVAQGQNRVVIFDAKSGTELRSIQDVNNGSAVTELMFSHDAKLLMIGDAEGKTNVFEIGLKPSWGK